MKIIGTKKADVLVGSQFPSKDTIRGKAGDDIIISNGGTDKLFGGKGDDTFIFRLSDGTDTPNAASQIRDFRAGHDTVVIIANEPTSAPVYDDISGVVSVQAGLAEPLFIVKLPAFMGSGHDILVT